VLARTAASLFDVSGWIQSGTINFGTPLERAMMAFSRQKRSESPFMLTNVPRFLSQFTLSYLKEGSCIEYFINRRSRPEPVSSALILSFNPGAKDLHVSRFYPELYRESGTKYMSAACFYLLIHHCAECYSLDNSCHISLETVPRVSECFYRKLIDFNFHVIKHGLGNVVELVSDLIRLPVNTRMIREIAFGEGEVPFLK
jgi:hypothetical protein